MIKSARWHDESRRFIRVEETTGVLFVPDSKDNADRARLAIWEVRGGAILDPVPASPAPAALSVTAVQMREALRLTPIGTTPDLNLCDAVEEWVLQNEAANPALRNRWEYETEFKRDNAFLRDFADATNLLDATLDALFAAAAKISS